jgi:adenylate kinase
MAFIPLSFSPLGDPRRKLLHVIPAGFPNGLSQGSLRSLNIEHVFPADLVRRESLRPTALGAAARDSIANAAPAPDELLISIFRRWFWSRKAGSGFCLHGFPANRLHASILDEWMEARDETLDACVVSQETAGNEVACHYRALGVAVVSERDLEP